MARRRTRLDLGLLNCCRCRRTISVTVPSIGIPVVAISVIAITVSIIAIPVVTVPVVSIAVPTTPRRSRVCSRAR